MPFVGINHTFSFLKKAHRTCTGSQSRSWAQRRSWSGLCLPLQICLPWEESSQQILKVDFYSIHFFKFLLWEKTWKCGHCLINSQKSGGLLNNISSGKVQGCSTLHNSLLLPELQYRLASLMQSAWDQKCFGFFRILEYLHIHNERSWGSGPNLKYKIHLCFICPLYT